MDNLNNIIITDILEVLTIPSKKGRHETMRNRASYGLSFCIDGQITYTHNGKQFISDKNCAVVLPQGQTYSLFGDKTGMFPVINFKCNAFLCDTITTIPIKELNKYLNDFEQMKSLFLFNKQKPKIMSIFYQIISRLCFENNPEPSILTSILKYIENNFTDPLLTNITLSQKFKISEVYIRKLFTKYYNTTPKQFIIEMRINKAMQLLTESILKTNVIAEQCGFSNQYHFSRAFKQKVGITPTEYQNQHKIYKI